MKDGGKMYRKSICWVTLVMLALALVIARGARVQAADIEPTLDDQKASLDKENKLHVEISAEMNAPMAKVYDALAHPEKVAKYDAQITGAKIVSQDAGGKIVEFKGNTLPIPNAPPAIQVKYTFDPKKNQVTVESHGKLPIRFQN